MCKKADDERNKKEFIVMIFKFIVQIKKPNKRTKTNLVYGR